MTAAQPESLGSQGAHSLEVRWIFPGQLAAAVVGWFGRFPAETRVVEDTYLLDPHLPGLSVKVRGGRALEVKVYGGSPGLLELAGRARGRLHSWQKWSFPHGSSGPDSDPAGWRPVSKRRRISWFSQATEVGVPGLGEPGQPGQVAADEVPQLPVAADLACAGIVDHHLTGPHGLQGVDVSLVQGGEVLPDRIGLTCGAGLSARQLHGADEVRKPRHLNHLLPLLSGHVLRLPSIVLRQPYSSRAGLALGGIG